MGERKVIQKYYPPDFDPSLLPRGRKPKNGQITVRMMLPMSVRCLTCGEYLYKGTKFNSKKETVTGEEYIGIKIFRFYMKCNRCSTEFTIKTDPENSDYLCEYGVSRNFEPWREKERVIAEAIKEREQEEEGDAMKVLENKTLDSKIEMDILDGLAAIRTLNAQNAKITADALLEDLQRRSQQLEVEDEEDLKSVVFQNSNEFIHRVGPSMFPEVDQTPSPPAPTQSLPISQPTQIKRTSEEITSSHKLPLKVKIVPKKKFNKRK